MAIIEIKLEFETHLITSNQLYTNVQGRGRVLTRRADKFKDFIFHLTRQQARGSFPPIDPKKHWIEAFYVIYSPKVLTKKGSINRNKGDEDGQIKALQDSICKALGFDDSLITESHRKQIHSDRHKVIVTYHVWNIASVNDLHF